MEKSTSNRHHPTMGRYLMPLPDKDPTMPRRVAIRSGIFATLLLCCVNLVFTSSGHAETSDALTTKLSKLGYAEGAAIDRVQNYRVDGWNYLDDQHIMIYAGPSKRFLITTLGHCPELSSVEHIGFTSTASSLTKFDKLIVRGAGGIVRHCPIAEIKTLQKTSPKP